MSQGGYKGPSQSSGGGGGTVVVIILVIGAVLGLGCLGVCGLGFFGFAFTAQQAGQQLQQAAASADATSIGEAVGQAILVATASDLISNDARVKEALGDPVAVEPGAAPAETISGDSHSFDLSLSGSRGNATGHVSGLRSAAGWEITSVTVTLTDGSTIDVNHNSSLPAPASATTPTLPPEISDPPTTSDSSPNEPTP